MRTSTQLQIALVSLLPACGGLVPQSTASCYLCTSPGVTDTATVAQASTWNHFDVAVAPEKWLGASPTCPRGTARRARKGANRTHPASTTPVAGPSDALTSGQ